MTYNRDLQEDKEPVFDSVDTIQATLGVLTAMLPRLQVNRARMAAAATAGYTLATELADYLSGKGVPFREAHGIVGAIVRYAVEHDLGLEALTVEQLRSFSPHFAADVRKWLRADAAVRRRRAIGGTSPENVRRQLQQHGRED